MRRPPPPAAPASVTGGEPRESAWKRARTRGQANEDSISEGVSEIGDRRGIDHSDAGASAASTSNMDVWRAARARRKALRAEIRRFTQRSRRRRIAWLSAIGAVVLLVGGSAAAAYSPLFDVDRVTVVGATTLDPAAVESALAGQIGTPLALVDASAVKAALLAFPLIESYALEAKPPHDLTVRIVERTPVGVIRSDAGYTLVDAAGVALSTTSDQPAGQPLLEIEGGADSDAFESAGLVIRSLPADVRAGLTGVRASTPDDVTLTVDSGLVVVWGSSENSPLKSEVLAKALIAKPDASSIDVTSPHAVVIG